MTIHWLGRSCFKIVHNGYSIVIDPYDNTGTQYPVLKTEANMVLVSHEHSRHNNRDAVNIIPFSGECPFQVDVIDAFHDTRGGIMRGPNKIHIITTSDGFKLVHTGDLGCRVEDDRFEGTDVLMIGCGSTRTMPSYDLSLQARVINPNILIPMHYQHGHVANRRLYHLDDLMEYFIGTEYEVINYDMNSIEITKGLPKQVAVLKDIV